jgi:hypothetical protein
MTLPHMVGGGRGTEDLVEGLMEEGGMWVGGGGGGGVLEDFWWSWTEFYRIIV